MNDYQSELLKLCVDTARKNNGSMEGRVEILKRDGDLIGMDEAGVALNLIDLQDMGHIEIYQRDHANIYKLKSSEAILRFNRDRNENLRKDICEAINRTLDTIDGIELRDMRENALALYALRIGITNDPIMHRKLKQIDSVEELHTLLHQIVDVVKSR